MEPLAVVTLSPNAVDEALFQADIPDGTYALLPVSPGATVTAEKRRWCRNHQEGSGLSPNGECFKAWLRRVDSEMKGIAYDLIRCEWEEAWVVREVV